MNLIVSTSVDIHDKNLLDLLNCVAKNNKLVWLIGENDCPTIHKDVPVISNIGDIEANKGCLIIASDDDLAVAIIPKFLYRVVLRTDKKQNIKSVNALSVDSYEQLKNIVHLDRYKGLKLLLSLNSLNAADFKRKVLENFSQAVDKLDKDKKAVVFGAQRLGELVFDGLNDRGVEVTTFVDNDTSKHGAFLKGIGVAPLSAVTDKELPVIIATTRFTYSISKQLREQGFKNVLPYAVLTLLDSNLFPDEIPYIGIQDDLAKNASHYLELFLNLADDKSRKVLDALLNYRINYDANFAFEVFDGYGQHYFDPEIARFGENEVFVDLGGYDGDTVENYIKFSEGIYKKIYMFEPDSKLLNAAKERLNGMKNIEFVPAGAYSFDGELKFSASGRTNGSFSDDGELVIPVNKIDSVVKIAPTFIKMDIEGSESDALRGSSRWIDQVKPRLAIAAYHKASDLWSLVNVMRELNPGYIYYLRHYSETGLETVIYAVNTKVK